MMIHRIMESTIYFILGWYSYEIYKKCSPMPIWWIFFIFCISFSLSFHRSKLMVIIDTEDTIKDREDNEEGDDDN